MKIKNKKIIFTCIISFITVICFTLVSFFNVMPNKEVYASNIYGEKSIPKYVFLFIGDGMGLAQINSTEVYLGSKNKGKAPYIEKMDFSKFPVQGMCATYAADTFITDSASAGTAIATGNKTDDGVINMDSSKTKKFTSMAEMAKNNGKKIGIVSSVSIDHATPAVFYAHQPSRNNYYEIALELAKSNFDYFGGGGLKKPTGPNKDKEDAYEIIKKSGYKVTKTKEDFNKLTNKDGKIYAISPKLDEEKAIPFNINNDDSALTLAEFTKKGIEVLDNEKGFFMMVEGGKIDWACHANDAASSIKDVIAFNDAVKEAIKFYEKHKDETLILVTADHETGGMTIGFSGTKYSTYFDKLTNQKISYDEFTNKVSAYRKEKANDVNLQDILPLISKYYGLSALDTKQYNDLKSAALNKNNANYKEAKEKLEMTLSPKDINELEAALKQDVKATDDSSYLLYGGYEPVAIAATRILNSKAGVAFTTYSHTGVPVPVYAQGVGKELFSGYYDNTDIFKKLTSIMGVSK